MILLMTNPLRSAAQLRAARARVRGARLPRRDRLLHQRDHAPRAPDPAHAVARRAGRATRSRSTCSRCATWRSGRGRSCRRRRSGPRPGRCSRRSRARLLGMGQLPEQAVDDFVFRQLADAARSRRRRRWDGLTVDEVLAKVDGGDRPRAHHRHAAAHRPARRRLRAPAGRPHARASLQEAPHGIDLGPLEPRLAEVINTASGQIELAPPHDDERPRAPARAHGERTRASCC